MKHEHQISQRHRLTLDVTPDMRRRIKLAAAQRDLTIREYIERILDQALPPLRELEARQEPAQGHVLTREAAERLLLTRDQLAAGRDLPADTAELIREAREERVADL